MSSSTTVNRHRPNPSVDEDLTRLYNEVWAVFAEEGPPASTEGDLDNIYNGYDDSDRDNALTSSHARTAPSAQTPPVSKYPPHLEPPQPMEHIPETPKSPTRRRLPPTPGESLSSQHIPMPDPEPYNYASSARPQLYNSASYGSFNPSDDTSLGRRPTTGSGNSSNSNPRLPLASSATNGKRPSLESEGRTPVSSSDYSSFRSNASYSSTTSLGTHPGNPDYSAVNGLYRPPGASPPTIPASYYGLYPDSTNPFEIPDFDAYDDGKSDPYSYQKPQPQASQYAVPSRPPPPLPPAILTTAPQTPPVPPPPPPKIYSEHYTNPAYPAASSSLSPYSENPPQLNASQSSFFSTNRPSAPPNVSASPIRATPSGSSYNDIQDGAWDGNSYYDDEPSYVVEDTENNGPTILRQPSDMLHAIADYSTSHNLEVQEQTEGDYWEDEEEEDENRFVNFALLSNVAMLLRDKIPRGIHVKGGIPYARAFTGKDVVSTVQSLIQRELAINHNISTNDRRVALQVARSLQSQLFFYDVEWDGRPLQDSVEDVYMFLDDQEGGAELIAEKEELPTGVITMLTRCYSPSCGEGIPCYAYGCRRKGNFSLSALQTASEPPVPSKHEEWTTTIDAGVLNALPTSEIERQKIIHGLIAREEQYLQDLDLVESVFIKPLRAADPPVIQPHLLDDFIDDVFGNILDLRECNRHLLEILNVRQREEGPVILRVGDIFLDAATEFRYAYPAYIGHFPIAEKRLKDEIDSNAEFKQFIEHCERQSMNRPGDNMRLGLKHFLNRPSEHLEKYPTRLEAVLKETSSGNADADFLKEAIDAIKNLRSIAQLRTFQAAMGKGTPGKWEWHDLVPEDVRAQFSKKDGKRQAIIFELIKGEMSYVKDLENILHIYINPMRADPSIIARERVEQFVQDVFYNYAEILVHHQKLVEALHEIQREQHPRIVSVTAALFDAALNWREAYLEYVPHYPIAAYRIDDEMANNPNFRTFVEKAIRHPDAHRLDMKNFINRPIPRLLRYELLLKGIMDETPPGHEDLETIPNVIEVIKSLGKETEPGVGAAKTKVELWKYSANLVFKPGEAIDMDLMNDSRSLVHSGKLLRQPESGLEWNGWSELFVLLFDNYLVMTKPRSKDGVTKYYVNRRPIPLDLLTLVNFTDPPTQRGTGLLRKLGGQSHADSPGGAHSMSPDSATDSRSVFPFTLHYNGRMGGPCILYSESAGIRNEWKGKLESALGLHKAVQDSAKVFEVEYLSRDTFVMPLLSTVNPSPAWNQDNQYTGKVTCSVPFNTADGRALVAIGCTEGVWIGFRHDPRSIRRVLHLKMVTQCAMLEDFGIFLVLADKALFAYHIEALVPSSPHSAHTSQVPQKLSGTKDVHFFSVGTLQGRTLIIYMKKKGLDSIFRVLEPVDDKIGGRAKAPAGLGTRLGFRSTKSEWFRVYRDFFLPSDSFDVIFLKARIAIFCAKGFEIMNLQDFDSMTIPQREDPRYSQLARRCESAKPLGMFRSAEDEFLLCYDEFGLYVDKHGDPSRTAAPIEWEGTAERVAFHSPYVLLFDSRFVEVRHVQTGRLVQIVPGTDVRCIWDGRGVSSNQTTTPAITNPNEQQEARVHFVMNTIESANGPVAGRTKNILQHVCELVPTMPIYPAVPDSATVMSGSSFSFTANHGPVYSPATAHPQTSLNSYHNSHSGRPGYSTSPSHLSSDVQSTHSWRS